MDQSDSWKLDQILSRLSETATRVEKVAHTALVANATVSGELRRLEQKVDDHAAAERERHGELSQRFEVLGAELRKQGEEVRDIDKRSEITNAKLGLWGGGAGAVIVGAWEAVRALAVRIGPGGN